MVTRRAIKHSLIQSVFGALAIGAVSPEIRPVAFQCFTPIPFIVSSHLAGPLPQEPLTAELIASGFTSPVFTTHAPNDFTRLFVLEKGGTIRILNLKTSQVNPQPFLTLSVLNGSESGLLGMCFHPDYPIDDRFYVRFSIRGKTTTIQTEIWQYRVSDDRDIANPESGELLFRLEQPEPNHNGGWIGFSPLDDYLYIALGDGGGANDEHGTIGNAQALDTLLGKILRIDVNGDDFPLDPDRNYSIPASNPFVGDPDAQDEIWAYGLRNPWRCSFDRSTGDFFIGDVGQNQWEEINFQPSSSNGGENYGWRCYEATHDFNVETHCNTITHVTPIREYLSSGRCSIIGGYRYRGCAIPSLVGEYFFADFCSGETFSISDIAGDVGTFTNRTSELEPDTGPTIYRISSYGEDAWGEIYIVDFDGDIFRIAPVSPTRNEADTNCNGTVDVVDLISMLSRWGPCDGCPEDLDGNHLIDVLDLLFLLSKWD